MDLQAGDVCVHADAHFKVIWNGSATFNVYDHVDNNIDVFTVYGITNSSDAIWEAKEYIDNLHKEIGGEYV